MKFIVFFLLALFLSKHINAQEQSDSNWLDKNRNIGIHTNLVYWGALTPNLGLEVPLARQWSIDVMGLYSKWDLNRGKMYRIGGGQAELRWWCCQTMTRHYVGAHSHYAKFNVGDGVTRSDGDLLGGGLSYGYVWVISKRWHMDFSLGLGYARIEYDKYEQDCNLFLEKKSFNYWGPTRLGVTLNYKIPY